MFLLFVDICEPNPCQNSGSCTASDNSFVCNCTNGFTGTLCQSIDYCANSSCQNGGSCVNGLGTQLCFCSEGFAGQFCEMSTDDIEDHCDDDVNDDQGDDDDDGDNIDDDGDDDDGDDDDDDDDDGNSNSESRTCSSFSVIRRDAGDRVNTPLSSVEYCSSIRAYCPDDSCSYCQCEFRLTYRHDLQRCDDYYNG